MLDDLKRALRMESPTPRLSESNLKKLSRGFRSSKKSRLSAASDVESCSVQDGAMPGRSASLSTLLPSGAPGTQRRPRVDKLQTVEAKMASIEVSLGSRKRREALLETLPRAARELVRELDSMQQALREKDTTIHSLKTQVTALGGSASCDSAEVPSSVRLPDAESAATTIPVVLTSAERKRVEERITNIHKEIDSKRIAVKNLKLTLDNLDTTDNIDVRIRAAEVEYELEREELNILNLREEATVLEVRLREPHSSQFFPSQPNCSSDLKAAESLSSLSSSQLLQSSVASSPQSNRNFQCVTSVGPQGRTNQCNSVSIKDMLQDPEYLGPVISSLVSVRMLYNPKNPAFRISASGHTVGCVVDWATDDTRLKRGDKLVEVNGRLVLGAPVQVVLQLIAMQAFMDIVVIRIVSSASMASSATGSSSSHPSLSSQRRLERQLEDRTRELKETQAKLDKALREKETAKNDKTRLTHRISYLEDQVAELEAAAQKCKDLSENSATSSSSSSPAPCPSGATVIQVYQKGQHTLAVASPSSGSSSSDDLSKKHPTPSRDNDDTTRLGPSARRTSSSSSKSSGHNPSCDSSSSGYSSYPSLRQTAVHDDQEAAKDVFDVPEPALTNAVPELRKSRLVVSPTPDFRSLVDSRTSHRAKPVPPKKPERLSLQRTTSLLSVDQASSCSSHSSKHRPSGHSERFHAPSGWKSIGDGLNMDSLEIECEVSSQASGRISVSSYKSDIVHKRRSRTYRDLDVSRTSSTSKNHARDLAKRRQSDHFPTEIILENLHEWSEPSADRRRRKSDVKISRSRDSWSSGTKSDLMEQAYNYCPLDRNPTYQAQSSGSSSSYTRAKSDDVEIDNPLDETISQNDHIGRFEDASYNSNFDERSLSATPTNSPLKFTTLKREEHLDDTERCASPKSSSEVTSLCAAPAGRAEAMKTSENKPDERSKSRSNGIHKPQTLSSIHNQKNYLSRDMKNRLNVLPNNSENRSDILPQKFSAFAAPNPRQAKENYPDNYYTYGCNNSSSSEKFSSLKRRTGRSIVSYSGTAPSTPLTPRSSSAMKLASSAGGPEDWC